MSKKERGSARTDVKIEDDGATIKIGDPDVWPPSTISDTQVICLLDSTVTKIDLTYCSEITDKTIISIAEKCPSIKEIHLSYCDKFTEESFKAIGSKCKLLEMFHAWDCANSFTEKGVEYLRGCESLRNLSVINCGELSDHAVELIVKSFPELEYLRLTHCGITSLPEDIGNHLKCLKQLNFGYNKLTKLPRSIANLADTCKEFDIGGNPLQEPPIKIAEQGLEAIKRYFEELDRGSEISPQLKVVPLGDGGAGKAMAGRKPALHVSDLIEAKLPTVSESDATKGTVQFGKEWKLLDMKLKAPRSNHSVVVVGYGEVIVLGGWDGDSQLASAEMLNLDTGERTDLPDMREARDSGAVVAFGRNIYVFGGTRAKSSIAAGNECLGLDDARA